VASGEDAGDAVERGGEVLTAAMAGGGVEVSTTGTTTNTDGMLLDGDGGTGAAEGVRIEEEETARA
jgi:hypothetical protein